MRLFSILGVTLTGALLLMSGCASKNVPAKHSGFLENYEGLQDDNMKFEKSLTRISPETDLSTFKNIYVAPVTVVSGIAEKEKTPSQKKLYKDISEYLRQEYKKEIKANDIYTLVKDKSIANTIVLEVGISSVEVHFDDAKWYQFSPIELGLTAVSIATYMDGAVRILGEERLSDAKTATVLMRSMTLQKDVVVDVEADEIALKDLKPALDAYLKESIQRLIDMRKGTVK